MTPRDHQSVPQVDPVSRFLGPDAAFNGPFGVLGLPVADVSEQQVLDALHRVMERIDAHPESRTPPADEARLAAHAAAANLLDHEVRRELLRRLHADGSAGRAPDRSPAPPSTTPGPGSGRGSGRGSDRGQPPAILQADLLRCIAVAGGWNTRAMRRFFMIAHERGFSTDEALRAMTLLKRPAPIPAQPAAPQPRDRHTDREAPSGLDGTPGRDAPRAERGEVENTGMSPVAAVLLTIAVFVVLAAGGWVAWRLTLKPAPAPIPAPQVTRPPAAPPPPPPPEEPELETVGRHLDNAPAIIHELEVANDAAAIDPEAATDTFRTAIDALSTRWTAFSPVDRLAARDQIIGFIYRIAGRSDTIDRAMSAIEAGATAADPTAAPDSIRRAVWSVGMLVRLRREQNLPGSIMRRIDSTLLELGGTGLAPSASTFRAGAVAALRSIAATLSRPPLTDESRAGWAEWPGIVHAAAEGDGALEESLLINALEGLLHLRETGGAFDEVVSGIVAAMNWRPGSAARVWLIRAFDDRSIEPDDLHVVTLALATVSKAEGVDHSMVLPRGASEYDRRRLRDVYNERWQITDASDRSDTAAAFTVAAREALLHEPSPGRDDAEKLASVVRYARLNAAGESLWRAHIDTASALLDTLDDPIEAVLDSDTRTDASALFTPDTGTWAETYLSEGSHIPRRLALLDKLSAQQDRLGPMAAEVLVTEALRGSPRQVRDKAAGVAELFMDQPTIVNAVLEALPLMPRTQRNAKIVELAAGVPLPPIEAPDWPTRARRAVVERLLQLIAGRGPYARIDALAGLLDEAYGILRSGSIAGIDPTGNTPPPPAAVSAQVLYEQWAALASRRAPAGLAGYSVDEIERRRRARLAMADGLVQRFHTQQLALAEMMAQVIAAEQPGATGRIAEMLDTLRTERTLDRNVLLQIERTERFMLSLRLIRLGDRAGESETGRGGNG